MAEVEKEERDSLFSEEEVEGKVKLNNTKM